MTSIGFQKDCNFIYTGSEDGYVKIFDLRYKNYYIELRVIKGVTKTQAR